MWLKRILCMILGHKHYLEFRPEGKYFCGSAGPYDCLCRRCDYDWARTEVGRANAAYLKMAELRQKWNLKGEILKPPQ